MKFFKKNEGSEGEREQLSGGGHGIVRFTIGAAVNLIITLDFLALLIASVVVIGTIGTVQYDLSHSQNYSTANSTVCFFYSSCSKLHKNDTNSCTGFTPGASHACDASMVGYAFIMVLALAFCISLIVKAVLHQE